ncbi:MAG: MFS transporter [Burkholderiaceae bacterium]|nr:MFS transporter [Microbacteriaceae bacterium]
MRPLGRRASFGVAVGVVAIALWTSAAPTVTYPLYAEEWDLTPAVTTAIFAVYPLVVVVVMAAFGNLSDYVGRRAAIVTGLGFALVGVVFFAVAPGVEWLFVGRVFMGIGVALSFSPATAAVVEFSAPGQASRASAFTTMATASGIALATLVGGALIEYAPFPTRLNYWVLLAVVAAVLVVAWFLPRHTVVEAQGRWRPRAISVPAGSRRPFAIGVISVTSAFMIGVIVLSLGADIAKTLIGSTNALVTGAIISVNAVTIGVAAVFVRAVRAPTLILWGAIATVVGMSLMVLSSVDRSLLLFLVSGIIAGLGYSFAFAGGLGLVTANAPAQHRAATLSAMYLLAYFCQGSLALLLGIVATISSLQWAMELGVGIICLFSLASLALVTTIGRTAEEPA